MVPYGTRMDREGELHSLVRSISPLLHHLSGSQRLYINVRPLLVLLQSNMAHKAFPMPTVVFVGNRKPGQTQLAVFLQLGAATL